MLKITRLPLYKRTSIVSVAVASIGFIGTLALLPSAEASREVLYVDLSSVQYPKSALSTTKNTTSSAEKDAAGTTSKRISDVSTTNKTTNKKSINNNTSEHSSTNDSILPSPLNTLGL